MDAKTIRYVRSRQGVVPNEGLLVDLPQSFLASFSDQRSSWWDPVDLLCALFGDLLAAVVDQWSKCSFDKEALLACP